MGLGSGPGVGPWLGRAAGGSPRAGAPEGCEPGIGGRGKKRRGDPTARASGGLKEREGEGGVKGEGGKGAGRRGGGASGGGGEGERGAPETGVPDQAAHPARGDCVSSRGCRITGRPFPVPTFHGRRAPQGTGRDARALTHPWLRGRRCGGGRGGRQLHDRPTSHRRLPQGLRAQGGQRPAWSRRATLRWGRRRSGERCPGWRREWRGRWGSQRRPGRGLRGLLPEGGCPGLPPGRPQRKA